MLSSLKSCCIYMLTGGVTMKTSFKTGSCMTFYLKCLLFSYILTVGLLLFLALLLYRFGLTEKMVTAAIIFIYIAASLFAGFLAGKRMGTRRFLWGLLAGGMYFTVLLLVSFVLNQGAAGISGSPVTVFLICAGSGMLGGMLS